MVRVALIEVYTSYHRQVIIDSVEAAGHELVSDQDNADVIILYASQRKEHGLSEQKIDELDGKRFVLAGCIAEKYRKEEYSKVGPDQLATIGEVITHTADGKQVSLLVEEPEKGFFPHTIPITINSSEYQFYIDSYCESECEYCKKRAKKKELLPPDEYDVLLALERAAESGQRILHVKPTAHTISVLHKLRKDIDELSKPFLIILDRFPIDVFKKQVQEIGELLESKHFFSFLQLDVVSGSPFVLEKYGHYEKDDLLLALRKWKKIFPEITLSFHFTIGLIGEKKEFFADSLQLVKEFRPDSLTYEPAKETKLTSANQQQRIRELTQSIEWMAFERNRALVGQVVQVYVTRDTDDKLIGLTKGYKKVHITEGIVEPGRIYFVKIVKAREDHVMGILAQRQA